MLNELDIKKYYSERNYMYMAIIELTTCCNWKCIHCFINEHNTIGLKTNEIYKLLIQLRSIGVYEIQFTGGEIFLRNDIIDIISYARSLKFKVALLTNTSLLNEEIIDILDKLYVEVVTTTLFSTNNKINDVITQSNNSASIVMKNIVLLSKKNIRTEIKTIVMNETENEYKNIEKFCTEKNIEFLATEGLFPMFNGATRPREFALDEQKLCRNIVNLDCIRFGKLYKDEKDDEKPICCELHYSLFIGADGNIYPCNLWYKKLGNIKNDKIENVWKNNVFLKKIQNLRWKDLPICTSCKNKDFCIRCSGIIEAITGDCLLSDEFACRTAKIRKKIYEKIGCSFVENVTHQ